MERTPFAWTLFWIFPLLPAEASDELIITTTLISNTLYLWRNELHR